MDMPKAAFDTWVRDVEAFSYQDGVLTLATENDYAREWLENRLTSTVNRLLCGILNRTAGVRFVVDNGKEDR